MSLRLRRTLLIAGCFRIKKWQSDANIPKEIMQLIEEFYPISIEFQGSKLNLTFEEKEHLTEYLLKTLIEDGSNNFLDATLLYNGKQDGLTSKAWHKKVDGNCNLLTFVETKYDHIFGCFSSVKFESAETYHRDLKSFLCVIRTQFKYAECPKFCRYVAKSEKSKIIRNDYGPYDGADWGPCFGHSFDVGIFSKYAPHNYVNHTMYTNYPDAFGNILCGGKELDVTNEPNAPLANRKYKPISFDIKHIETFRIDIK